MVYKKVKIEEGQLFSELNFFLKILVICLVAIIVSGASAQCNMCEIQAGSSTGFACLR